MRYSTDEERTALVAGWLEDLQITHLDDVDGDTEWVLEKMETNELRGAPQWEIERASRQWEWVTNALGDSQVFRVVDEMPAIDAAIEIAWELKRSQAVRNYVLQNTTPERFLVNLTLAILQQRGTLLVHPD